MRFWLAHHVGLMERQTMTQECFITNVEKNASQE
jgi:hypothetical protein